MTVKTQREFCSRLADKLKTDIVAISRAVDEMTREDLLKLKRDQT